MTRGKSLETPLAELRNTITEESPHADFDEVKQAAREGTNSRGDKSSVADEYERKQREQIVRQLLHVRGAWVVAIALPRAWE